METLWIGVFVVLFLFMHAIAHRGCAVNTVRESALKGHWEKKKEKKNMLPRPRTRTCVNMEPGFSVRRSTNLAVPMAFMYRI